MTEKEIAELRRRFRREKSNITHIRGCCVNDNKEIISQFDPALALMTQEEAESFLALLKRCFSGSLGKNLIDIVFETQQVVDSEEHRLLSALRDSALSDEAALQSFFQLVAQSLTLDGSYLILLGYDSYDVPYRAKDGLDNEEAANESFRYIVCAVCPIKTTPKALSYYAFKNEFHNLGEDWVVSPPELGFTFPAFDQRSTNLYGALYYTKNSSGGYPEFVDAIFHAPVPLPAAAQREAFEQILGETLENESNLEVVQAVHDRLCEMDEVNKENKDEPPVTVSKAVVHDILKNRGISQDGLEAFGKRFEEQFGAYAALFPKNLIDTKYVELRTDTVKIQVDPARSDVVETRVINGAKYILIRADEGVTVNGVSIQVE